MKITDKAFQVMMINSIIKENLYKSAEIRLFSNMLWFGRYLYYANEMGTRVY